MSTEALLDVVPPPAEPFEAFTGPWEALEAELRTTLPQDFKNFVRLYGSGHFMDFFGVYIPRTRNPNTRFETEGALICQTFADWDDDELPHPMWPAAGGLLNSAWPDPN